jgi:hypothetical protein
MIKKLRNQSYAPKWEQAPKKWEQRGRKKNTHFPGTIIKSSRSLFEVPFWKKNKL